MEEGDSLRLDSPVFPYPLVVRGGGGQVGQVEEGDSLRLDSPVFPQILSPFWGWVFKWGNQLWERRAGCVYNLYTLNIICSHFGDLP